MCSSDLKTTLCDTVVVYIRHYTFVKTPKMYNIKREPKCKLWTLVNSNVSGTYFPGGTVVKNLPATAGDTGSSPGPRRSRMARSN